MGSNPTPRTKIEPSELINFALWLRKRGIRESTIERKLKFLRSLERGSIESLVSQVLNKKWVDKSKALALKTLEQFAEYKGLPMPRINFKAYSNAELYVPSPEMIRKLVYRIRKPSLRACIFLAIETGASAGEVLGLTWKDINLNSRTLTIRGLKGHKTNQYQISCELVSLLTMIPRNGERVFNYKTVKGLNDSLRDYLERLARETGNSDFLKLHFHSLRHYAISFHYFKTKDIVETQRFARHCNIQNTLRYVHIVNGWTKEKEYDVVYAESKAELTKYLSEGYELVAKTEWGYCLRKPKTITTP